MMHAPFVARFRAKKAFSSDGAGHSIVPGTPRNSASVRRAPSLVVKNTSSLSLKSKSTEVERQIYNRGNIIRRQQMLRSYQTIIAGHVPIVHPLRGECLHKAKHTTSMYEWRQIWRDYERNLQLNDPIRHSVLMCGDTSGPGGLGQGFRAEDTTLSELYHGEKHPTMVRHYNTPFSSGKLPTLAYCKRELTSPGRKQNNPYLLTSHESLPLVPESARISSAASSSISIAPSPTHKFEKFNSPCYVTGRPSVYQVHNYLKECRFKKSLRPSPAKSEASTPGLPTPSPEPRIPSAADQHPCTNVEVAQATYRRGGGRGGGADVASASVSSLMKERHTGKNARTVKKKRRTVTQQTMPRLNPSLTKRRVQQQRNEKLRWQT